MPGLDVHRETAVASARLINVPRGVVEDAEHGDDARRFPVGAADGRVARADVVHVDADAARPLGDLRALAEGLVDALDGIVHASQVARRKLAVLQAGVEERGRRVRRQFERHGIVRFLDALEIVCPDAERDAQQHVLRALDDAAVDARQVQALERPHREEIVAVVPREIEHGVERVGARLDRGPDVLAHHALHLSKGLEHAGRRVAVQVADRDVRREDRVVGVLGRHARGDLRRQRVDLGGRDVVVEARARLLRDLDRRHAQRRAIGDALQALGDLVEVDVLEGSVTLDDLHDCCCVGALVFHGL